MIAFRSLYVVLLPFLTLNFVRPSIVARIEEAELLRGEGLIVSKGANGTVVLRRSPGCMSLQLLLQSHILSPCLKLPLSSFLQA